jgi:hypothetical protein
MFKKAVLSVLIVASASQAFAIDYTEHTDGFGTRLQKEVFELVYFGKGLSTLVSPITEFFGNQKSKSQIDAAIDDAQFFQNHVASAKKGEYADLIYQNMVIHVRPDEVVTRSEQINENSSARHDVVVDSSSGTVVTSEFDAVFYKINGRTLISDELNEAHMAARSLIFNDMIEVPENRTKAKVTSDAVILNNLMIDYARTN